jgi:hypothetical protein
MNRRELIAALAVPVACALSLHANDAAAAGYPRRRVRHRIRVRRRIRRRTFTRIVYGRPFWVVPVRLAVGWELMHANRVVVVREIHVIEKAGVKSEVAVVQGSDGKTEQIAITREDTPENARNLEGSVLDEGDTTTPAIEEEARD